MRFLALIYICRQKKRVGTRASISCPGQTWLMVDHHRFWCLCCGQSKSPPGNDPCFVYIYILGGQNLPFWCLLCEAIRDTERFLKLSLRPRMVEDAKVVFVVGLPLICGGIRVASYLHLRLNLIFAIGLTLKSDKEQELQVLNQGVFSGRAIDYGSMQTVENKSRYMSS